MTGVSGSRPFCYTHTAMESILRQRLMRQARFSESVRTYFRDSGYAEVDTPVLSPFLIPEPAIEVFQTEYLPPRGPARPLWLAPSPELWMKRLLAAGAGDIFQVSRSFRNAEYRRAPSQPGVPTPRMVHGRMPDTSTPSESPRACSITSLPSQFTCLARQRWRRLFSA